MEAYVNDEQRVDNGAEIYLHSLQRYCVTVFFHQLCVWYVNKLHPFFLLLVVLRVRVHPRFLILPVPNNGILCSPVVGENDDAGFPVTHSSEEVEEVHEPQDAEDNERDGVVPDRVQLKFSVKVSGLSVYIFTSQCKYFATLNII